uniref:Uncharacterized protein n=1 Tax=Tetraselmis sp. GSL018 TaxID=582737 RepID=A0A061QJA2_9CHLO
MFLAGGALGIIQSALDLCLTLPRYNLNDQYCWSVLLSQGLSRNTTAFSGTHVIPHRFTTHPSCVVVGGSRVMLLPAVIWNRIYSYKKGSFCGTPANTRIYHFTGIRKKYISEAALHQSRHGVNNLKPKQSCVKKPPTIRELPPKAHCNF